MIKLEQAQKSIDVLSRNGKTVHKVPMMQSWPLAALQQFAGVDEKTEPVKVAEKSRAALLAACPALKREKLTDVEIMQIIKEVGEASEIDAGE